MNIIISDSWLREFIKTKATPEEIGNCLSLCSQSVEKITSVDNDYLYDIEITTNRPDCLSVFGIARELVAVLPQFGFSAELINAPVLKINKPKISLPLMVKISQPDLCPRFTGLVFDNITIKPSPDFVQKRLNSSNIRALNNVIDISNYLMLEMGQPMHTFDYDKIGKNKMILREAVNGEEIITLDGQTRKLTDGIMVIEDGDGRIIDLCGIMGAKNSETDEKTKRVLLFVQTYNPMKIRRACQSLGFRTEAASRFEKGIDPEGVILAMERASLLFKDWCSGKTASNLIDIYPEPQKKKSVSVSFEKINSLVGINIPAQKSEEILKSLGFFIQTNEKSIMAQVPHYRHQDISIPEDLIEEIARIYGYHNLSNELPPVFVQNTRQDAIFQWENKIKTALKYWGWTETMSYSLTGSRTLTKAGLTVESCLKIANPLTDDLVYLRTSLVPSLLEICQKNKNEEKINIFEMANTYLPKKNDELPEESMSLTLASNFLNYLEVKGTAELLLKELGIENLEFKKIDDFLFLKDSVGIFTDNLCLGTIGKIKKEIRENFGIKNNFWVCDLEIKKLVELATDAKKYSPVPKFPAVIEDLTFTVPSQTKIGPVISEIGKISKLVTKVDIVNSFQNAKTFRVYYQSDKQNLSENDVKPIREKIILEAKKKFHLQLKTL